MPQLKGVFSPFLPHPFSSSFLFFCFVFFLYLHVARSDRNVPNLFFANNKLDLFVETIFKGQLNVGLGRKGDKKHG